MKNISIIGLEKIGCSLSLALKASGEPLQITGLDRDPKIADRGRQFGALDKTTQKLTECLLDAHVIFLATPTDEVQDTLQAIQPLLKPGMVIVDTTIVLATSTSWAPLLIPSGCSLISLTPTLNPEAILNLSGSRCEPDKDLFRNSVMALTSAPGATAVSVDLIAHLAKLIGASVWLADPQEAASMIAGVNLFPQLVAAASLRTLLDQPSWEDSRKLAGANFLGLAEMLHQLDEREKPGKSILMQRETLIRLVDACVQNLKMIRNIMQTQDEESLQSMLKELNSESVHWWLQRSQNNWGNITAPPAPCMGEIFKRLIQFGPQKGKKQE